MQHRRLGHLNFKALSTMEKMDTGLLKLNKDHSSICKGTLGKNTKSPFQDSTRNTKNVLQLVHSDLCGPMFVPSLGRFQYYILFIYDFSKKTWIYFLKCKELEEILKRFIEFKSLTKTHQDTKLKLLGLIMKGNILQIYLKIFVKEQELKGSILFLIILGKMEQQKGRIGQL